MHGNVTAELEGANYADVFRSDSRMRAELLKMRGTRREDAVAPSEGEQAHWRYGHSRVLPVAMLCITVFYQRSQNTLVSSVLMTGFQNHRTHKAAALPIPSLLPRLRLPCCGPCFAIKNDEDQRRHLALVPSLLIFGTASQCAPLQESC